MNHLNFMSVWRKRAKLSQWELAQKLHISQTDVSDIETGKVMPSLELREKICELVGQPLEKVFPNEN